MVVLFCHRLPTQMYGALKSDTKLKIKGAIFHSHVKLTLIYHLGTYFSLRISKFFEQVLLKGGTQKKFDTARVTFIRKNSVGVS